MELTNLEQELQRVLHSRGVPPPVADPVGAVHAGMSRRRRTQRLQVLSAGLGVVVVAVAVSLVAGQRVAGLGPQTRHPATAAVNPTPTATPTAALVPPPPGFQVQDLSFIGTDRGWALGTAPCSTGRCGVLLATDDGGSSWDRRSLPDTAVPDADGTFAVDCSVRLCVSSIRFVRNDVGEEVGYAFGPGLALTTDGGRSWTRQLVQGAVTALEAARGNVIRLQIPQGSCPGCTFTIQRSTVGGASWEDVATPTAPTAVSASLDRQSTRLAVLLRGHTSGGSSDARSRLVLSTDDGQTWTEHDDPCGPPSPTAEVDATQVALASDGGVAVLCQSRGQDAAAVRVSTDSGKTYGAPMPLPAGYRASLLSAPGGSLIVDARPQASAVDRLLRSTDGGATWAVVASQTSPSGSPAFLDFTSDRVGTWISPVRDGLWRTDDSGQTWVEHRFG